MSEDQATPSVTDRSTPGATPDATPDATPAATTCELCGVSLRSGEALVVSGHAACARCVDQLELELAARAAGATSIPTAAVGALVGALVGAAVWAGIAIGTDYEIGYVAVLVGYLAGRGATRAAGGRHGPPLQAVAVLGAVVGLLAAKYAIFAYAFRTYVAEEYGETVSYLDTNIAQAFTENFAELTSGFDLLWIFLAVSAAWRVPAAPRLHVSAA